MTPDVIPRLFAVLVLMIMAGSGAEAGLSSVDIINWSIGEPLWVRCKSRDNDLQWQLLQTKQDYRFVFHENIVMNTVFWCRFEWGPHGLHWLAFTVWDRDHPHALPLHCGNCVWRAESRGMYIWDKVHQEFDFYRAWNNNGTSLSEADDPSRGWLSHNFGHASIVKLYGPASAHFLELSVTNSLSSRFPP